MFHELSKYEIFKFKIRMDTFEMQVSLPLPRSHTHACIPTHFYLNKNRMRRSTDKYRLSAIFLSIINDFFFIRNEFSS